MVSKLVYFYPQLYIFCLNIWLLLIQFIQFLWFIFSWSNIYHAFSFKFSNIIMIYYMSLIPAHTWILFVLSNLWISKYDEYLLLIILNVLPISLLCLLKEFNFLHFSPFDSKLLCVNKTLLKFSYALCISICFYAIMVELYSCN